MQQYTVFIGNGGGAFGPARRLWLLDDDAALVVGRRALNVSAGVDIWRDGRRVICLRREYSGASGPAPNLAMPRERPH